MLLSDRTIISQENIALFNKSIFRIINYKYLSFKYSKFGIDIILQTLCNYYTCESDKVNFISRLPADSILV